MRVRQRLPRPEFPIIADQRIRIGRTPEDIVAVSCWCETEVLAVPWLIWQAGRTGSCGRDVCHPKAD